MGPRTPLLTIPGAIYARLGGCSGSCVSIVFGPVGQVLLGRVCLTLQGVLCVCTRSAEPLWLSFCFCFFVHVVDVSGVTVCAGAGGETPSRCAHESTHRSLAVALQRLKITCRPIQSVSVIKKTGNFRHAVVS